MGHKKEKIILFFLWAFWTGEEGGRRREGRGGREGGRKGRDGGRKV